MDRRQTVTTKTILKALLSLLATLVAAEAALVGAVEVTAAIRRSGESPPPEGFPWEEQPEVTLDSGSSLKLYPDHERLYEDMLREIEGARERVFVETFIWQADVWGRRFVEALAKKAREGVEVYAIFDELASIGQPAEFKRFPEEINLLRFRGFSGPLSVVNPRTAHREHRKLLAVDGRVAFLGEFNIGELYTTWRGTHLRVRGEEARSVARASAVFWNTHRAKDLPKAPVVRESAWDPSTNLLVNDPYRHALPIRDAHLRAVGRADERLCLTTAYFVPGPAYREALVDAAGRGVDVQVLIPERSNHALVDWLARSYVGGLLSAGVRIFEYKDFMLHANTLTVDGVWSTVGSCNVDTLSLFGLNEINLEVYSERFASQMEGMFELDKTNAEELTLKAWKNRPAYDKVLQWGIAPLRILG
jgi:cardiolipin synthase